MLLDIRKLEGKKCHRNDFSLY